MFYKWYYKLLETYAAHRRKHLRPCKVIRTPNKIMLNFIINTGNIFQYLKTQSLLVFYMFERIVFRVISPFIY